MDDDTIGFLVLVYVVIAAICGAVMGIAWLVSAAARLVTQFVTTAIIPRWHAIVIGLVIVAILPLLIWLLAFLLTPPVRLAMIRRHWRKLGAAERRRGEEFERQINQLFREAKRRANDIDRHI